MVLLEGASVRGCPHPSLPLGPDAKQVTDVAAAALPFEPLRVKGMAASSQWALADANPGRARQPWCTRPLTGVP